MCARWFSQLQCRFGNLGIECVQLLFKLDGTLLPFDFERRSDSTIFRREWFVRYVNILDHLKANNISVKFVPGPRWLARTS